MSTENSQDDQVVKHLHILGVDLLSEWDALSFLYRHAASLGTVAQIARSIGYDKAEIGTALQKLETLGLIQRSRVSQGTRLYEFTEPPDAARRSSLLELMSATQNRAGRLVLLKHLKRPRRELRRRRHSGLRLA